jgi:hypothetical protein
LLHNSVLKYLRLEKQKNPRRGEGSSFCGDERDRTVDLLLAKQALYQLSYIPISGANSLPQLEDSVVPFPRDGQKAVGKGGKDVAGLDVWVVAVQQAEFVETVARYEQVRKEGHRRQYRGGPNPNLVGRYTQNEGAKGCAEEEHL